MKRFSEASDGIFLLDDSIEEKPYIDENEINCWHYSHAKGSVVKGVNILTCMVRYCDFSVPVGYEVIKKDVAFCDIETKQARRKSSTTKNELFRKLIAQAASNHVLFDFVLADNWFGSKANMAYIHNDLQKSFIIGIKSNRTLALSKNNVNNGRYTKVSELELEENMAHTVYLKGLDFPVRLLKKIFKNENGSTGVLYLVSNDMTSSAERLYEVYQKRWRIEEYHKSIKQNASLNKSPTRTVKTQSNHIFAAIIAYCKLEMMKIKTKLNHFAIKYKLILRANQIAMQELKNMAR
ncbi:TPA: transposase [Legionella pneumophila subsp. pneumophila]|nr:transposase [Legionella pneumophila]RYW81520.1 transposase [Legionella pneumophila]RYW85424.1 transposase [Legionella pneumophila]HAT8940119.1 transposase [Legionella pneumophila subsp. pneumophila]HAT9030066.1 transposase [Legionella pneumophila subsp. pneumophila]HAU0126073.1 transposase [Legionella pneumophila]